MPAGWVIKQTMALMVSLPDEGMMPKHDAETGF